VDSAPYITQWVKNLVFPSRLLPFEKFQYNGLSDALKFKHSCLADEQKMNKQCATTLINKKICNFITTKQNRQQKLDA